MNIDEDTLYDNDEAYLSYARSRNKRVDEIQEKVVLYLHATSETMATLAESIGIQRKDLVAIFNGDRSYPMNVYDRLLWTVTNY